MTQKTAFYSSIVKHFSVTPNALQKEFMHKIVGFLQQNSTRIFILKGYAGTGKTTCIAALNRAMNEHYRKTVLIAPTGRAAKVMEQYAQSKAFTIHRLIYNSQTLENGDVVFKLARNNHKNTLFICDEASMIACSTSYFSDDYTSGASVISDLVDFVNDGENCKLLLSGDPAQLPPVGETKSHALSPKFILEQFLMKSEGLYFKSVLRQKLDSGILLNATAVRESIGKQLNFPILSANNKDVIFLASTNITETLEDAYAQYGKDQVIVLTYSNAKANAYNQQIRIGILDHEEEITPGDLLMVVKNNFFWGEQKPGMNFIANGEIGSIVKVFGDEEAFGFRFYRVSLNFPYQDDNEIECLILPETLMANQASLPKERNIELYRAISSAHMHIKNKKERNKKIKENEFLNALQVKFAYAVTTHKSQGGQWPVVIIDAGYLTEEKIDNNYLRWLYTAITRAKEKVYLVNFSEKFVKQYS